MSFWLRLLWLLAHAATNDLTIGLVLSNHLIDLAPVRKATHHGVIDEDVRLDLATEVVILRHVLFGEVLVDSPKLNPTFPAPLNSLVEQLTLTYSPKNELMMIFYQLAQCLRGKWEFTTDFWIAMLYDSTVEIYSNFHFSFFN